MGPNSWPCQLVLVESADSVEQESELGKKIQAQIEKLQEAMPQIQLICASPMARGVGFFPRTIASYSGISGVVRTRERRDLCGTLLRTSISPGKDGPRLWN